MPRKPHHDLPAIPEVSTPHEVDDDDDDEATVGSYAFTLDGVGFDEESGSIMHTPPQLSSSYRMSRQNEAELHRQTCRTLGVPCNDLDSPRENSESTSVTSDTKTAELYDVPLKSPGNKPTLPPKMSKPPQLINRAKIAEIASFYAELMKQSFISFTDKSKKLYANSKEKFLTQEGILVNANKGSFDPSLWYPKWFTEANPLVKLTTGMAFIFFTLFIVVVVAVSRNNPPPLSASGGSSLSTVLNDTLAIDSASGSQAATSMPSYAPTLSPTMTPPDEQSNICMDELGSFETSRGKSRDCSWLKEKHLERECGGLGEKPSELGLNCKMSCRKYNDCIMEGEEEKDSKRVKKNEEASNVAVVAAATEPDEEVYFLDINNRLRPCTWLDIRHPTVRAKRREEYCPKTEVQDLCPVNCLDYMELATTPTQTTSEADEENEWYFTDSYGQQQACSWLDIKNTRQRTKRREANCVKLTTQIICSESCQDYEIPITVNKQDRNNDIDTSASSYVRSHDLVPQDECYDRSGYFLNDNGHPVECSWLTENASEVEIRREKNCGENQDATDLGEMCKHSCGKC